MQWTSLLVVLAVTGCGPAQPVQPKSAGRANPDAGTSTVKAPGEATAKDLAAVTVASGCAAVSECTSAPVGLNTCGYTNRYVIFCTSSTDVTAFDAILAQINARDEERYGDRREYIGSCLRVSEPTLELVDGTCREKAAEDADDEIELIE